MSDAPPSETPDAVAPVPATSPVGLPTVGIAPADVHILATGRDDAVFDAAGRIARDVEAAGVDVLYDDRRKVSAGVKFADYELLGMPWGVVVGRGLAEGRVEIRNRRTGERTDVPVEQAPARLRSLIADE